MSMSGPREGYAGYLRQGSRQMRSTPRRRSARMSRTSRLWPRHAHRKVRVALRWRSPGPRTDTTHCPISRYQLQRWSQPI